MVLSAGFLGGQPKERSKMMKVVVLGTTALFLASPVALAQTRSPVPLEERQGADQNTLLDMRIDLTKAALDLTPEQQKLWPPVEAAIRNRGEDRRGRIARVRETVRRRADESSAEIMKNRGPMAILQ